MIILRDISLRRGSKLLLSKASVTLQPGQRLALVGANGCGKSSLFALLLGELAADGGRIDGLGGLRLAHMAQQVAATDMPAGEFTWRGDSGLAQRRDRLCALEADGDYAGAARVHAELEEIDGYSAERRAERLLLGLGFNPGDAGRPVSDFSGGWRIRLNLARALMTPSDLLLLDEPTNHLDLDATLWLQQWLQQYPGTLLMISHDRDFIDATCERVLHMWQRQLETYRGNYSAFERQRAERLESQRASHARQQRRVAEIEAFVRRFRAKATKARQAQSRLKELERMREVAPAHLDSPFDFRFEPPERSSDPLLVLERARLGYPGATVLEGVELRLRPGSRIGLLGRNGAGKSTLLKSLVGHLPLIAGERRVGEHCRVGYFDQQQLEALDVHASPALHLRRLDPQASDQAILDFLGGFDFRGAMATDTIGPFSGGEKARLALALVVWQKPNLLVLDEPTNHLDLDMRHAVEMALQTFAGALMVVSHDRHLLRNTAEQLLLVDAGGVEDYQGDLDGYEQWVLRRLSPAGEATRGRSAGDDPREKRRLAAARRQQRRPLQQQVERTEAELAELAGELARLRERLADAALYAAERRDELADLLLREGEVKTRQGELEEAWLQQQQALEELGEP